MVKTGIKSSTIKKTKRFLPKQKRKRRLSHVEWKRKTWRGSELSFRAWQFRRQREKKLEKRFLRFQALKAKNVNSFAYLRILLRFRFPRRSFRRLVFKMQKPSLRILLADRRKLLDTFRHPFYLRFTRNNFFLNTNLSYLNRLFSVSTGVLGDYQSKKKKKRTYLAGFETTLFLFQWIEKYRVKTVRLYYKGAGKAKKGVRDCFMRNKYYIADSYDVTPIAHNGTRSPGKRRL